MSRNLFNRSEAVARPVRTVSDRKRTDGTDRPVYIEKGPYGTKFFDKSTGEQITREYAIALMRAYKHGAHGLEPHEAKAAYGPRKVRKAPRHSVTWKVELYRTVLLTGESKLIAQAEGQTFLAVSTKLASLCMKHKSDKNSAVEVQIEQVR